MATCKGRSGLGGAGLVAVGRAAPLVGLRRVLAVARGRAPSWPPQTPSLESAPGRFRIEYAPRGRRDARACPAGGGAAVPEAGALGHAARARHPQGDAPRPPGAGGRRAPARAGLAARWSRYDEVFVQAPSTWGLAGATPAQVDELLLHELTHSLMYQLASDRLGWSRKQIPLWFREGMASFTADQAYRWVTLEEIARHLESFPGAIRSKSRTICTGTIRTWCTGRRTTPSASW